jgi:hypothetical protein
MKRAILFAATLISTSASAMAESGKVAVGLGVGTTGLEGHVAVKIFDELALRGTATYMTYSHEGALDDISYDGELDFSAFGAFADFHPFGDGFTITAGAYFGSRSVGISAMPSAIVTIGDVTYTPAEVGKLSGSLEMGDFAPYVGIGYDSTFESEGRLGFRIAAGVAFGDPQVDLTSTGGTLSANPAFLAELQKEEDRAQDDAGYAELYPVVSIGLAYRLN